MKKAKIAVVGLGNLGELHTRHLQFKIGNAEVIAVCDLMEGRARQIQQAYDIPRSYTDYDEMLRQEDMDAVIIVSNLEAHLEHVVKACNRKVHIFCEKPLARHLDQCREMEIAVERNAGKIFTLGFMRRFDPSYAEAKARVLAGEIGRPILFKGMSLDPDTILDELVAKSNTGAFSPWFLEMGAHDTDLARWFLGSEMACAYSTGGCYVREEFAKNKDYDNGFALATYENGSCAFFHVGKTSQYCHVESEIVGTKGTIRVNGVPRKNRLQLYYTGGVVEKCLQGFLERWEEAYYLEMVNFINCVLEGTQPEIGVRDGTRSLEAALLLQQAYLDQSVARI